MNTPGGFDFFVYLIPAAELVTKNIIRFKYSSKDYHVCIFITGESWLFGVFGTILFFFILYNPILIDSPVLKYTEESITNTNNSMNIRQNSNYFLL